MSEIQRIIKKLRSDIEEGYLDYQPTGYEQEFRIIDEYLAQENVSDLEKAFYLFLNQFPGDHQPYVVVPNERLLLENSYDPPEPMAIEYEIDFAIYAGTQNDHVKIAIECDGLRSHRQKDRSKERRKEVNLQVANWIVMRYNSKEILDELKKFKENEFHVSDIHYHLDHIIKSTLDLITHDSYYWMREQLTGYIYGHVECPNCEFGQIDILNHKNITCRQCGTKYERKISKDEKIYKKDNGLLLIRK